MARYGMVMNVHACLGCRACMAACSQWNQTPFWAEDFKGKWRTRVTEIEEGKFPEIKRYFFPTICMHCVNPPCASVCPTEATYINKDGIVLIDYDLCLGCGYCIEACPYDARYEYELEDLKKDEFYFGEDARHHQAHVDKCTFCVDRLEEGLEPSCAATCVGHARIFGDLDDPNSEVAKLVNTGKAKPLGPYMGTKPKVYYIK